MSPKYNWLAGFLAVILTLIVLFGGQLLWNKYALANPINKTLQSIEGIESVSTGIGEQKKNNGDVKVYVKLNNVPNLQKTYSEITEGLNKVDNGHKYEIYIQDSRTPELEQFYYSIHYYIQEAIFTGKFASMAEQIQVKATNAGVVAQVYVDNKNIYLKMAKGTDSMYTVVARVDSDQGEK